MPTYTYRCNNCEYQFEIKQRMADDPLTDCPECETDNALRKVLNSVGIVFKGSGFYVTDSRGKKSVAKPSANGNTSENGSSAKADSNAKEGSDSKTEKAVANKETSKKTAA
ncbi:FmdB family zinc ribbon protein [Candidatus Leptofilum sp.]|uniref:FmdB family zinc ribbon protein n=1 Tax=Candidatus Leptofilum sp. TaxID=3241576 RepID=UPI003B5A5E05